MSLRNLLETNFPLGTTEQPLVSNEGFSNIIGSIKTILGKRPKKVDFEAAKNDMSLKPKEFEEFRRSVKAFYGNRTWVAKQTLETEDITTGGIAEHVSLDGKLGSNPFANVKEGQKRSKKLFDDYGKLCKSVGQQIQAIDKKFEVDYKEAERKGDSIAATKIAEAALEAQKGNVKQLNKLPTLPTSFLGSIQVTVEHDGPLFKLKDKRLPISDKSDKIKPLTVDQIVEAATMAVALLDGNFANENTFIREQTRGIVVHWDDNPFHDFLEDNEPTLCKKYYRLLGYEHLAEVFDIRFATFDSANLFSALVTWIERSIKNK